MAKEHLFYCSWPDNYPLKDHNFGKVNKFVVIGNLKNKKDGFRCLDGEKVQQG